MGADSNEKAQPRTLQKGKRYRLLLDNRTDDAHPIHLHRNSFELTNVNVSRRLASSKMSFS